MRNNVTTCKICQITKGLKNGMRAFLVNVKPGYPNKIVRIDITDPLRETDRENKYILVMFDPFIR